MTREEIKARLNNIAEHAVHTRGEKPFILSLDDGIALKEAIEALSAEPCEVGHWVIIDDCEKFIAKCSECGEIVDSRMISKYSYCHCGAKMKGEKE